MNNQEEKEKLEKMDCMEETVYSNFDHRLNKDVVKELREKPNALCAGHAAEEFYALIYFNGEEFVEVVWRYKSIVGVYKNKDIKALIEELVETYGSE